MLPYVVLALSPVFWGVLASLIYRNSYSHEKRKRFIVVMSGISLFSIIALRSCTLGSYDSIVYYDYWKDISSLSFQDFLQHVRSVRSDKGFSYFVWFLSHIPGFANPQYAFVFSGMIFSVSICLFIFRYCDDVILGFTMYVCLGLYTFMVQGMRQSIAMCICLTAIPYCMNRKLIRFVATVLLASVFHQTAVVFIAVYFLYNRKMDAFTLIMTIGILMLMIAFSSQIISFANSLFNRNYSNTVNSGGGIAVLIYIIALAMGWLFRGDNVYDKEYCFFYYLTFLGFCVYFLRYVGTLAAERISFYFMAGQLIVLPASLRNTRNGKELVIVAIWALSILLFVYRLRNTSFVPYRFFWQ